MKKILLGLLCIASISLVFASDESNCNAVGGSLVSGIVSKAPYYKSGSSLKGVELSHTHISLVSDQDGQTYDVAMDNVFASGYDQAGNTVPYPLNTIKLKDHVELCGALYTSGGPGIHWVHTNCGETPSATNPDGWVKEIYSDSSVGNNFEDSSEYCSLWN
jgi:hypothetical protein